MKDLLEGLLPRVFPNLDFLCIPHRGKTDLERSIPRKLRGWGNPSDRYRAGQRRRRLSGAQGKPPPALPGGPQGRCPDTNRLPGTGILVHWRPGRFGRCFWQRQVAPYRKPRPLPRPGCHRQTLARAPKTGSRFWEKQRRALDGQPPDPRWQQLTQLCRFPRRSRQSAWRRITMFRTSGGRRNCVAVAAVTP